MNKRFFHSILCFALIGGALEAAMEFVPLQEKAQGQSLTGSNQLNDSLYSNPASSAFVKAYAVDASLQFPKTFAVSVLDTKTSTMGGALGYFRKQLDQSYFNQPDPNAPVQTLQGAKVALSGQASTELGVGIAGKSVWGPNKNGVNARVNDIDAGLLYNAGMFELGFSTRNILGGDKLMDAEREFALGGKISYNQILSLSVATQSTWHNPKPYQYGIGAEYVSPYYFALKGGYRILTAQDTKPSQSFWGLGASFVSPKISFHYAMEIPTTGKAGTEHVVGTTVSF